jgi:hypothetical protein
MQLTRGYISCSIVTTGPDNFQDQQLQQWGWTNSPPIQITTSNQLFSATWSVTGSGSKFTFQSGTSPTGQVHTQSNSLAWTESGSLTVQMQVRSASNNQVVLTTAGSIVLPGGLTGTQQITIDGIPQTPGQIGNAVYGLPLPAVQWNGPQYTHRNLEGIGDPGPIASPSSSKIGSRLGLFLPWGSSYAGTQQQPNPQLSGYQAPAGTISTANWSWRIYF